MTAHVEPQTLADLQAGLLDGAAEREARAHLAVCAACSGSFADIGRVPALLGTLASVSMPDDVAAQLQEAIAAESAALAATRHKTRTGWWRAPRAGVAAATVAVLLGGGIALGSVLSGNQNSSGQHAAAGDAANAAKAPATVHLTTSGNAYTATNLQTLIPPLVSGLNAPRQAPQPTGVRGGDPLDSFAAIEGSGQMNGDARPGGAASSQDDAVSRLAACAVELEPAAGQTPLDVDIGTYEGTPAAVFVYTAPKDAGYFVYVVKATDDCSGGLYSLFYHVKAPPAPAPGG